MRRRTDETQQAALDIGQQDILLGFVEAVNLINEENGLLGGVLKTVRSLGDHTTDVRHIALNPAQTLESGARRGGDDLGKTRLPNARRPIQNDRRNSIRLNRAAQEFPWAKDVPLADVFIQRPRTHPRCQRSVRERRSRNIFRKQVLHHQLSSRHPTHRKLPKNHCHRDAYIAMGSFSRVKLEYCLARVMFEY